MESKTKPEGNKDLKEKAIDFKGKKYVLVSDRVIYFNETYPEGYITTDLISSIDAELVVFRADVYPDGQMGINGGRHFTGWSQAKWGDGYINKTSALENCETSAVGRALAMMGIGVIDSIASIDEINKTTHYTPKVPSKAERDFVDSMPVLEPTEEEIVKWQEHIDMSRDLVELGRIWKEMPSHVKVKLEKYKNERKFNLT